FAMLLAASSADAFVWLDDPPPPDTTAPVLVGMPSSFSTEAVSSSGASVSYSPPTATDDTDPSPTVSCSPTSGSSFPLGQTTVTCTATDASNNSTSESFTVTVVDTTPPTLGALPGAISDETENPGGKVKDYTLPTATDTVDPSPSVQCSPASGSTFPIGSTTVHCHATDNSGNASGDGTFTVTITLVDHTAPTLSLPGS